MCNVFCMRSSGCLLRICIRTDWFRTKCALFFHFSGILRWTLLNLCKFLEMILRCLKAVDEFLLPVQFKDLYSFYGSPKKMHFTSPFQFNSGGLFSSIQAVISVQFNQIDGLWKITQIFKLFDFPCANDKRLGLRVITWRRFKYTALWKIKFSSRTVWGEAQNPWIYRNV